MNPRIQNPVNWRSVWSDMKRFFSWRQQQRRRRRPSFKLRGRELPRMHGHPRALTFAQLARRPAVFPAHKPSTGPYAPAALPAAPPASLPPAPGGIVAPAAIVRRRPAFYLRPRPDGVPDILDAIQDIGGIASPAQSRFADRGDYDGFKESVRGPARVLVRSRGGMRPDELAEALGNPETGAGQIWRLESTSDLWDAIDKAVAAREAARGQFKRLMQDEVFQAAALGGKRSGCRQPRDTAELKPGDRFTVRRDPCTVRRRDESGEVSVKCETRFGTQRLPPAGPFYPDKCQVEKAPAPNPAGFFDEIETPAQQKARLEREALKRKQAEEIAERSARRLVGRGVDTTGDMFDPLAGDAPLFSLKKRNPVNTPERFIDITDFEGDQWRVRERDNWGGYFDAYNQYFGWQPYNWGQVHLNFPAKEIKRVRDFFASVGHPPPPFRLKNPVKITARDNYPVALRKCRRCKTRRIYAKRTGNGWQVRTGAAGGFTLARKLSTQQLRQWAKAHGYKIRNPR